MGSTSSTNPGMMQINCFNWLFLKPVLFFSCFFTQLYRWSAFSNFRRDAFDIEIYEPDEPIYSSWRISCWTDTKGLPFPVPIFVLTTSVIILTEKRLNRTWTIRRYSATVNLINFTPLDHITVGLLVDQSTSQSGWWECLNGILRPPCMNI